MTSTKLSRPLPQTRNFALQGFIFLTITGLIWGTSGAVATLIYDHSSLGPMGIAFWRQIIATLLLLALLAIRPTLISKSERTLRQRLPLLVAVGIGMAVFQAGYFAAVAATGITVATMVTLGSGPVLTAIGQRLFLNEHLPRGAKPAVVAALLALTIIVVGGSGDNGGAIVEPLGIAFSLLSATGFAAVTLFSRSTGSTGNGENPMSLTIWSFAIGSVVLFPFAWAEGLLPNTTDHFPLVIGLLVYKAVIGTAIAYPLYFAGTARVKAATASVLMLLEPATAAVLAIVFFDEPLTIALLVGCVMLLGSILVLALAETRTDSKLESETAKTLSAQHDYPPKIQR